MFSHKYFSHHNMNQITAKIKTLGKELGFEHIGITDTNLLAENIHLKYWLDAGYHGEMKYFEKNIEIYNNPEKLLPGAKRIICLAMPYPTTPSIEHPLASYAQLQDYSKLISGLLECLVEKIKQELKTEQKFRIFAGNGPVLEKALACKAGLGWYGKNSLLINKDYGSFFFLGEIITDLELPIDQQQPNLCGNCDKCIKHCPTKALVAPGKLDAKRCISYLTDVYKDSIPLEIRPLIGTQILGCDICQNICPWNNKLPILQNNPFQKVPRLTSDTLVEWFLWSEEEFKEKVKDSPFRRLSYECWLRNIAVALGNSAKTPEILIALKSRLNDSSPLVREHIEWALGLYTRI
jgi:epoxyqueuosine reductase